MRATQNMTGCTVVMRISGQTPRGRQRNGSRDTSDTWLAPMPASTMPSSRTFTLITWASLRVPSRFRFNHHGALQEENPFWLATLRSRVMIVPAWAATHPSPDVLKRMLSPRIYPEQRDINVTLFRDATKAATGARAARVASDHGHIVVRVEPGGARYWVPVLDDAVESYRIASVHVLIFLSSARDSWVLRADCPTLGEWRTADEPASPCPEDRPEPVIRYYRPFDAATRTTIDNESWPVPGPAAKPTHLPVADRHYQSKEFGFQVHGLIPFGPHIHGSSHFEGQGGLGFNLAHQIRTGLPRRELAH